jgi:hypothetical protein
MPAFMMPLAVGVVGALLCYLSLLETASRGSAAAVALYQRRALTTSAAFGLAATLLALLLSLLG